MKKYLILFLCTSAFGTGDSGPEIKWNGKGNINFNVNIKLGANASANAASDAKTEQTTETKNENINTTEQNSTPPTPEIKTEPQKVNNPQLMHIHSYWPFYALGSFYSYLFYRLVKTNYVMNDRSRWFHWKEFMSLERLQEIPQQELAKELLHEIQNHYMNPINPTDSITPLSQFMNTVDYEKKLLQQYLKLTDWLKWLWLRRVFPFNDKKIKQANQLLARLNFMKHIFISWAASHKMNMMTGIN